MNDINTVVDLANDVGVNMDKFLIGAVMYTEFKSVSRWDFEGFTLSSDTITDGKINIALEELQNLAECKNQDRVDMSKKLDKDDTDTAMKDVSYYTKESKEFYD